MKLASPWTREPAGQAAGAGAVRDRLPWPDGRLSRLLESAPDAVVIADRRGRIALVNAEAERMFGYAREDLLGRPVQILVPERFWGPLSKRGLLRFPLSLLRHWRAGLDLSGLRKDGQEFAVDIRLRLLRTDGGILAWTAIRDVSRRRRTDSKFWDFVESAPDAMVIVDPDHARL